MRNFEKPAEEPVPAPVKRATKITIDTRRELTELLARVAASDGTLTTLDLSGNRQFFSLSSAMKNQAAHTLPCHTAKSMCTVPISFAGARAVDQWQCAADHPAARAGS